MSTSIWGEKLVELIGHNGIGFKDGVSVRATNANPVASGLEAQLGSVCLWVDKAFIKTGPADNAWTEIATQAFIDTVTALINDHIADTTDAHDATAISSTNTLGANVELVLTALKNYKDLGLQSAYNEYPDITVDAVNPIKIKNIAGDTQTYPLQVRSNDEGDIYFAAGKDNTFVKNVTFSADSTKKIELTDNSNIKVTDSIGTRILKEQVEILHHQDFREDLPSTYLTASDASLTITDTAGDLTISGQYAVVTQSSASIGYYVESEAINVTNEDWTRAPIRIDLVQGLTGGDKGDWVAQVYKSDDGVTYTAVNTTIPVTTSNQTDKLIFQLQSNTAYLKVRWTIVTADDAIDLNIGRIKITSEALPVGEQIVTESYTATTTIVTGAISALTKITSDNNALFTTPTLVSSGIEFTVLKDGLFFVNVGAKATNNLASVQILVNGTSRGSSSSTVSTQDPSVGGGSLSENLKAGDLVRVFAGNQDSTTDNPFSVSAIAKADSVYVDGEIHGTIGEIVTQSGDSIPQGTLLADGSAVSRTTYAKLFGVIGTTYGVGDGSTTFNLPDYRGYFLRGWSTDATVDPDGPRAVGSIQEDAFQGHEHQAHRYKNQTGGELGYASNNDDGTRYNSPTLGIVSDGTNGTPRTASETRPINKAVKYYIRYEEKTVLQIPVGAERENTYTVSWSAAGVRTGGNHAGISVSKISTGVYEVDYTVLNLTVVPTFSGLTQGNVSLSIEPSVYAPTTTKARFVTITGNGGSNIDAISSIGIHLSSPDYKEPAAFIANAVSITNHVTGGTEYPVLGETIDGEQVYAIRRLRTASYSSSSNIIPSFGVPSGATIVDVEVVAKLNASTIYKNAYGANTYFYDPVSDGLFVSTSTSHQSAIATVKYLKP